MELFTLGTLLSGELLQSHTHEESLDNIMIYIGEFLVHFNLRILSQASEAL